MAGAARTFYHGVPRVMEGTLPSYFHEVEGDDEAREAVKRFMRGARININARQVFPVGFVPGEAADGERERE
jgi:alkylated DNA repair protein alkB family protein 1